LLTDKAMLLKGWSHRSWSSTDAITTWWTVMRQLFHRCKQMCFLDQLRSSSAPALPLAITAGVVPKEAVDAYSAGTPGLTLVFMGLW
jgi:hypothetical protein